MTGKRAVLRGLAVGILIGGAAVHAAQTGLIPRLETDPQNQPPPRSALADTVLSSTSRADGPGPGAGSPQGIRVALPNSREGQVQRVETAPDTARFSPLGLPCDPGVAASVLPVAMAALDIMAPCQPETIVTIEHAGMTITDRTDAMGLLTLDIPALASPALFTIAFAGGDVETAVVELPLLASVDRVAIAWSGDSGLELHAIEHGADDGSSAHVWHGAPGDMSEAIAGRGGFLVELGDRAIPGAAQAQIYSMPRGVADDRGALEISVDAEITDTTCGRSISARTIARLGGTAPQVTPITLTMPGCEAVGDYLVLQNIRHDLRLAAN